MVRYLNDGTVKILFPNGATSYYHNSGDIKENGKLVPNGYRFLRDPIKAAKVRESETQSGAENASKLSKATLKKQENR